MTSAIHHSLDLSHQIPLSIKTLKNKLSLNVTIHEHICCPNFFYLYNIPTPQLSSLQSQSPPRPHNSQICDSIILGNYGTRGPCNTPLWEKNKNKDVLYPIKSFTHQSLKTWLATRLLWPEFEKLLDAPFQSSPPSYNGFCDIWDGGMWKSFKDQEGNIFTSQSGNLVFGLYLDWVNPHGLKVGGKSCSLGVILLTCFNLPPDIQYKPHNLFVYGFTPTPREPKSS